MLDVHPPHAPTHTWRDFFIHIATIVVGLIIAVGLEQSVEAIHNRIEVHDTREALRLEREENYMRLERYVSNYPVESAGLENNRLVLTTLLEHPGTPDEKLPGVITWHIMRNQFATTAWHTAQMNGVLPLMPKEEVVADEAVYKALDDICNTNEEEWQTLNDANRYQFTTTRLSSLSGPQISEIIVGLQKVMVKHYLRGNFMQYPHTLDFSFNSGPSQEQLSELYQTPLDLTSPPALLTQQRLKNAGMK
jgi:hypothetical protein